MIQKCNVIVIIVVITPDGVKHSLEKGTTNLRINDIQRSDNGTYECRAEVDSYGELTVRHVDLNVVCE